MTLTQINYFLAVSKCLSFSEAARRLYITQPTLSRQIAAMEAELNMQLFLREKKNIRLTPAGAVLFEEFSDFIKRYNDSIQKAQIAYMGMNGVLNIGILEGHVLGSLFHELLDYFEKQHPNIQINTERGSFAQLIEGLYNGMFDLILSLDFDVADRPGLEYLRMETIPNRLVVSQSHPKASMKDPRLIDFKDEIFIANAPEDTKPGLERIQASCKLAGFTPRFKLAPTLETYMLWVEAGYGVSVLSERNTLFNHAELCFLPIPEILDGDVVLAWKTDSMNAIVPICINAMKTTLKNYK